MRHEIRLSLEIDFDISEPDVLPEASGKDLKYLGQLLASLDELVHDTAWPQTRQGEFLEYVTRDVYEFSCAIRTEAAAGRWTVATSLMRPLQERSEYALAAAVDPRFAERYFEYIESQIDKDVTRRTRGIADDSRGVINRWENDGQGEGRLLEISKMLNSIGSELLHSAVGLSGEDEAILRNRSLIRTMLIGRVQCAVSNVMLAVKVLNLDHTKAWHRALSVVTLC